MAIGTITIVNRVDFGKGEKNFKCTFDGDDNYPTGGTAGADVLAALKLAIKTAAAAAGDANVRGAEAVTIKEVIGSDCGQYEPYWASGKLKVLDGGSATRAEVANGTDLSGTSFGVTFICD
jgi:hypothetical protein